MGQSYRLAFDMGQPANLFDLWFLLIVPMVAGVALILRARLGKGRNLVGTVPGWLIVAFCAFIGLGVIWVYFPEAEKLRAAERAGGAIVSEGCLSHFHPESRSGGEGESIEVAGKRISYSEADETPAFHVTQSYGGPIHADSRVRVTTVLGSILKLEVRDHACPPAPDEVSDRAR